MHRIYPINEEVCNQYWGRPVMVVLNDGTRHIGTLSGIEKNQLVLNGEVDHEHGSLSAGGLKSGGHRTKSKKKSRLALKATTKGRRKKGGPELAKASGFGPGPEGYWSGYGYRPFPYFGERLAIDLAAIALLFLIFI